MKYVLDSSVALKTVLPESDSPLAIRLVKEFKQGIHELIAPDVLPIEVGHALTRAERQGRIAVADGWILWQSIMSDCPNLHPSLPLMPRAFELSSAMRLGVYDCSLCGSRRTGGVFRGYRRREAGKDLQVTNGLACFSLRRRSARPAMI